MPEAEFFKPPLTTVHQDFTEAGRRAVHLLLDLIRPDGPASIDAAAAPPALIPTELVVRRSSGLAR
jgi:DNA-binding LacI/PurR family transcriptional regulator